MVTEPASRVRLVLLPSPLLGPSVWRPVADELRHRGRDVVQPPPYGAVTGPGDVLAHLLHAVPEEVPVVLVPHSNAGLYAAALAAERDVRGVVFVDAGLPSDGLATPTAPEPFRAFLASLVDEHGMLPVWTEWWAGEDLSGLFPDHDLRAAVEAEQVRLPLAYFEARVPSPAGWESLPTAYLAFGDAYADERATGVRRGWPTITLAGEHLHPLVDPGGVADALLGLVGQLGLNEV